MTQTKEASFIAPNSTLPETLAASLAIGGGSFATMRLLQELMAQTKPKHEPGENDNTLTIDLPRTMMPNYMQSLQQPAAQAAPPMPKQAGENINKAFAIAGGVPAGFLGAKYLYDKYKEYQLKQELELANKRYMQAMTDFNNPEVDPASLGQMQSTPVAPAAPVMPPQVPKMASTETPAVDAFCEKLAEDFNKKGGFLDGVGGLLSALPLIPDDPGHIARRQISQEILQDQLLRNSPKMIPFNGGELVGDGLMLAGGLAGAGAFGAMAMANKNREQAEKKRQFPSAVEINYA